MGKGDVKRLPVVQQSHGSTEISSSRTFFCQRFSNGVCTLFNLKCAVVLIFSVACFLSAIFWLLPLQYRQAGFDAKDSIKLSASVQAYFKLQKPVLELVPYIARLEYDINEEIGVPSSKVAVLSMHPANFSSGTDVVFGFLSDPINSTISPVSLSVLKPSLIDLFLKQYNLTLTSSIFGESSSFEILNFPGGVTIIPEKTAFILQIPQVLFNFTLNGTIYDIKENLLELKEQLKLELNLMPSEVLYIQVTNKHGSTIDPPVTIEASVSSDLGTLLPERLRQLAQVITRSPPTENLGLDHSVFGKVKEIHLSSFLNHSLHAPAPTPSPSPALSPEQNYDYVPSEAPSNPPTCSNCYTLVPSGVSRPSTRSSRKMPRQSLSPVSHSPAQSVANGSPNCGSIDPPSPTSHPKQMLPVVSPRSSTGSPLAGSLPQIPPSPPFPAVAYVSRGLGERNGKYLLSPPQVSPSSGSSCTWRIQWFYLIGFPTFLLFWISWM